MTPQQITAGNVCLALYDGWSPARQRAIARMSRLHHLVCVEG